MESRHERTPTPLPTGSGWLSGLLLTAFVIGTDDFIIAGILPEISADLGVSEGAAGQLVTVFSITYAIACPVLAVATGRVPRKALIVAGLAVFALVNFITALAPSFGTLMALRVVAALVAATLSPAAFAAAGRLAAPERTGRAIGTVAAGLTLSLVAGVPLGSWVSGVWRWEAAFIAVGALSCLAVAVTALMLPSIPRARVIGVAERLRLLRRPPVLLCVLGTMLAACGGLMPYVYMAPITHDLTGVGGQYVGVFIAIVGVSGAVGTVLGGRLTDRWGVDRTLLTMFGGVVAAVLVLLVVGAVGQGAVPVWAVGVVLVLWGVPGWGNNPPMNARAMHLGGDAATEALALNTSGLYAGIALAGAIGGGTVNASGGIGVLAAACAAGLITIVVMALSVRRYPSPTRVPEGDTDAEGPSRHHLTGRDEEVHQHTGQQTGL
ncbi:MFS transporter [Streptomyces inusitatus]|uniref:MFS transporter n=1 Tax=Streptomyces inusitatus TaxID=68221 RepID=A0A918QCJ1_9ACTN|nr:MFS transporter [Streptomyces inusitatus]GGZ42055.1 MFS transporter [Streptomyces inusitatus]